MKKIILFLIIFILLAILSIGIFLYTKQQETANLKKFYNLTSEDPLFYSPFFDSVGWKKAIEILKDSEIQFKKVNIVNIESDNVFSKAEKNHYLPIFKENNLFPYQFLEYLILINQKTNEFLNNPSTKLGKELIGLYDNAADSYIQDISSKIKILEDNKSFKKIAWPEYFSFTDSSSNSEIVKNDFLIIKENGYKLKEEVEKRRNCLIGKDSCLALPQENKKIDAFIDSLNAKFTLKGKKIDFIKSILSQMSFSDSKLSIKGPYKIKSSCWESPDSVHWTYLIYVTPGNGEIHLLPKLATQNYYWKVNLGSKTKTDEILLENGLNFYGQNECTTYECTNLTFYPELLALDFLKEQIKSEEITEKNLEKKLDYKLLIENQFGLMVPVINTISKQLKTLTLYALINKSKYTSVNFFSIRSAYSVFYFPFAKSIWRTDKQLQYIITQGENPLMRPMIVTLDELEKLGYSEKEIIKFTIKDIDQILDYFLLQEKP